MRAVLFDLDGTLLDLDLEDFLGRYFEALEVASLPLATDVSPAALMRGLKTAVGMMMQPHPGRTNRDVFFESMRSLTGVDLEHNWGVYERFYAEVFPTLQGSARPAAGGREAVLSALRLGMEVAIATNPIFPREAIMTRLAWAGLADLDLPVITTYEVMEATKPLAGYFRQTAEMLGVHPADCLMVGDDRRLDLPAADVGMRTYYVGADPDAASHMRGTLHELAALLPVLA